VLRDRVAFCRLDLSRKSVERENTAFSAKSYDIVLLDSWQIYTYINFTFRITLELRVLNVDD